MGWKDDNDPQAGKSVTIDVSEDDDLSTPVDLGKETLVGVLIPAGFEGTVLTFLSGTSVSGTFVEVQAGTGSDYTVTVAASKYVAVDPSVFMGVKFLKIASDANESADRLLKLATRNLQ